MVRLSGETDRLIKKLQLLYAQNFEVCLNLESVFISRKLISLATMKLHDHFYCCIGRCYAMLKINVVTIPGGSVKIKYC